MQASMSKTVPIVPAAEGTYLPPIEKPKGLMMKLAYVLTRRQFGKVLTPLKVHSRAIAAGVRPVLREDRQAG